MVATSGRVNGRLWTLAPALRQLLEQVDTAYPDRPKRSDGSIGDPAHQSRASDHNRNDDGMVTAIDLTDWQGGAFDVDDWARRYAVHDPRVKYLISDGQIWSSARTDEGWRDYDGSNEHDRHLHVSVHAHHARNVAPWAGIGRAPTTPKSITSTTREQIMAAIYLRDDKGRIGRFTDEAYAHLSATEWATEQATAKRFGVKSIPVVPVTRGEFDGLATSRLDVKALNRAAALAR
jgi:hypothetical protein